MKNVIIISALINVLLSSNSMIQWTIYFALQPRHSLPFTKMTAKLTHLSTLQITFLGLLCRPGAVLVNITAMLLLLTQAYKINEIRMSGRLQRYNGNTKFHENHITFHFPYGLRKACVKILEFI
jgi:hypothetical protein